MKRRNLAALATLPIAASASAVMPISYDILNGNGTASGGNFNYWDKSYTGSGDVTVDNSVLTGGLGDLTDGVIATENWFSVENNDGTGPYVGWRGGSSLLNPTVTFNFAGITEINSITVHADDSDGAGGVSLPDYVRINGVDYDVDQDVIGSAPIALTFNNLNFTGSSLDVQFFRSNEWVFVSEVTFDGQPVPEPATMLVLGTLVFGVARRRAKK